MEELKLVVDQKLGTIMVNFEEVKEQLAKEMDAYKNTEITEEGKADAKKDVANLRKLRKAIEDKRKEVKKEFLKPYEAFESKEKELLLLIDEPINLIESKVSEFEQKRVAEKKELISTIYADFGICDVPLSAMFRTEWENTTYSKKKIHDDMEEAINKYNSGISIIKGFHSYCEEKALQMFVTSGYEIENALSYIQQYEEQKKQILQMQEEAKKKEEEQKNVEEVKQPVVQEEKVVDQFVEEEFIPAQESSWTTTYQVKADGFQLVQLEAEMRKLGIEYRRVE